MLSDVCSGVILTATCVSWLWSLLRATVISNAAGWNDKELVMLGHPEQIR